MDSILLLTIIIALVFAATGMSSPLITLYLEGLRLTSSAIYADDV